MFSQHVFKAGIADAKLCFIQIYSTPCLNITLPHSSSNHLRHLSFQAFLALFHTKRELVIFFLGNPYFSTDQHNFSYSMSICPPRSSIKYFLPIFLHVPLHTVLFLSIKSIPSFLPLLLLLLLLLAELCWGYLVLGRGRIGSAGICWKSWQTASS